MIRFLISLVKLEENSSFVEQNGKFDERIVYLLLSKQIFFSLSPINTIISIVKFLEKFVTCENLTNELFICSTFFILSSF